MRAGAADQRVYTIDRSCQEMRWYNKWKRGTASVYAFCCNDEAHTFSPGVPHSMCQLTVSSQHYFDEVQNVNRVEFKKKVEEGTDKPAPKL